MTPFKRNDFVQTWFHTGAMGAAILYGVIVAAGPKAARVRWESGITNRIAQDCQNVKPAVNQDEARKACAAAK